MEREGGLAEGLRACREMKGDHSPRYDEKGQLGERKPQIRLSSQTQKNPAGVGNRHEVTGRRK
jgi:hypothetical protein